MNNLIVHVSINETRNVNDSIDIPTSVYRKLFALSNMDNAIIFINNDEVDFEAPSSITGSYTNVCLED